MRPTITRARGGSLAVVVLLPTLALAVPLLAQGQAPDTTSVSAPYRSPPLVLASPLGRETLPQDKPSIVLRYGRGEPDDPLDLASLAVLVDGENRSAQFHADSMEAWGSIDPLTTGASAGQALALGVHQLTARICSARGVCTDLKESVTIAASALAADSTPHTTNKSRLFSFIAAILALIERLFTL